MKLPGTKGYDELTEARAAEIDQIIDELAQFGCTRSLPAKIGTMFEHVLLAYAALRSRSSDDVPCTVLLGQATYDRARETGLLAWCAEHYPNVTFEPSGYIDEAAEFPSADENLIGLIEKP